MKKRSTEILTVCILLLASNWASAQYTDITFNPLSALTGTAVVMVEVPVNQTMAVELQSSYFFEAERIWTPDYSTKGYRIGVLGHLYMNEDLEHTEWSILTYVRYLNVRYDANEERSGTLFDRDSYNLSQGSAGFGVSFKRLFDEHFVLSVGGGIGRNFARKLVRSEGQTGDFFSLGFQGGSEFDIYGRVTLGYRIRYSNS